MKHLRLFISMATCIFALAFVVTVFARDYSATISVTGGSAQKLSDLLTANGYTGFDASMSLDMLDICNPSSNLNDLKFGQSNVATTGFALPPGICKHWPPGTRPSDANSIYLYVSTTQNAAISLRSR